MNRSHTQTQTHARALTLTRAHFRLIVACLCLLVVLASLPVVARVTHSVLTLLLSQVPGADELSALLGIKALRRALTVALPKVATAARRSTAGEGGVSAYQIQSDESLSPALEYEVYNRGKPQPATTPVQVMVSGLLHYDLPALEKAVPSGKYRGKYIALLADPVATFLRAWRELGLAQKLFGSGVAAMGVRPRIPLSPSTSTLADAGNTSAFLNSVEGGGAGPRLALDAFFGNFTTYWGRLNATEQERLLNPIMRGLGHPAAVPFEQAAAAVGKVRRQRRSSKGVVVQLRQCDVDPFGCKWPICSPLLSALCLPAISLPAAS